MGALSIAVTGSVLGTSLVVGLGGHATISGHVGEVEGTVETARKIGDIDIKGEFLVLDLEHLVLGRVRGHEVDTGTDVGIGTLGDKLHGDSIARGGDTVCTAIVGTIDGAVLGAGDWVGAKGGVPGVTGVAVGIARGGMEPAPVCVQDDTSRLGGAGTASSAGLPSDRWVRFGSVCTDLLAVNDREEGEREKSDRVEHGKRGKDRGDDGD